MKFSSEQGIQTGRWLPNELMIADDINFVGQAAYINTTNQLAAKLGINVDETKNYVIGGLELIHSTALTMSLNAGIALSFSGYYLKNDGVWGFVVSAGEPFSVHVGNNSNIAVSSGGTLDRIDLIEIRPVKEDFDSELRQFKNPVTGEVGPSPTNTKTSYEYEFAVREGTEAASPVADATTSGWIKLAEVYVAGSASSITQDDIYDVRRKDAWTTEAAGTLVAKQIFMNGLDTTFLELDTVPKVSIGSQIEANGVLFVVEFLETPTGSAQDGAYLFFDSSVRAFVWSTVAGTYDAVKKGVYDGSDRRQCRFILRSSTEWVQILEADESTMYGVADKFTVLGGRFPKNKYHLINVQENSIFDLLSPFIPNTNDIMAVNGSIQNSSICVIVSYVERTGAGIMWFYGLRGSTGSLESVQILDGDTGAHSISITW